MVYKSEHIPQGLSNSRYMFKKNTIKFKLPFCSLLNLLEILSYMNEFDSHLAITFSLRHQSFSEIKSDGVSMSCRFLSS